MKPTDGKLLSGKNSGALIVYIIEQSIQYMQDDGIDSVIMLQCDTVLSMLIMTGTAELVTST